MTLYWERREVRKSGIWVTNVHIKDKIFDMGTGLMADFTGLYLILVSEIKF